MSPKDNFANIPSELRALDHWLVWRIEQPEDRKKPTKVPYSARTGRRASSTNPAIWSTFNEALGALERGSYGGIGFVFTDTPYIGVDIDGCLDGKKPELEDAAADIVNSLDSYTELSPSRNGLHSICKGKLPDGRRRNGPVEMYGHKPCAILQISWRATLTLQNLSSINFQFFRYTVHETNGRSWKDEISERFNDETMENNQACV